MADATLNTDLSRGTTPALAAKRPARAATHATREVRP